MMHRDTRRTCLAPIAAVTLAAFVLFVAPQRSVAAQQSSNARLHVYAGYQGAGAREPVAGGEWRASLAPPADSALARLLDSTLAVSRAPGISLAVAWPDGRVLALTAGLADSARGERLSTAHSLMQGSVGKSYVAAIAMQLVQEGRLELDAPISRWLGNEDWFARLPNARDVAVRMLMNHTSGLVRYEFDPEFTADLTRDPLRKWRPEEQLSYLFGDEPPFAAGEGWEYSDTNYIVLGLIIERITGRSYHTELRERLLLPLRLTGTFPVEGPAVPHLAQGYAGAGNAFGGSDAMLNADGRMTIDPSFEWTGGGVASTTADLARWAAALWGGRVLDPGTLAQMTRGVPARLGPNVRYGFGTIIRETPAGLSHGHSGFFPGYITDVMWFPEYGLAVAVQANSSVRGSLGVPAAELLARVAELLGERGPENRN
jgi:D-alanyl-D-alanine carboxypeptidase